MNDALPHSHPHSHQHDAPDHHLAQGLPHLHAHDVANPQSHGREVAPDSADNLVLDIGADTGALIIHATADRDQAEIEISPAGSAQPRAHNIVRRREPPGRVVYAAVFPALAAGDYDVWRDQATKAGTVTVQGGQVARFSLH